MSLPVRILLRFVLTILLVWALSTYVPQYFLVKGGLPAYVVIASLLTLLNLIVRPLLDLAALPVRLVAHLLALILVNGLFLWIALRIAGWMDPAIVRLSIGSGIVGWIVAMILLGTGNWLLRLAL
jgi:uncharacterized membrane protein YvlD (DUF360 family)